ncbi:MAG: hypothetical protein QOH60_3445 [Mycobacterium sp.]|jgi:uncharacterized membrane protein HdeD (DUF308 family)|nr:hypothetical protein [Mycobacterium sp.]
MTDTKQHPASLVSRIWKSKLLAGVLTAALGAAVLAWPGPSVLVAATLFGVYLLVSGIADVFLAVALPRSATTRVMLFISGALSVVLAILSFRHFGDSYAVLLLSLWIGIGFVFQGVSATVVGVSVPELPERGWYIVSGIVSVIGGAVMLVWPFDSIAVLTLAAGIWLVIMGVVEIVYSLVLRKDMNKARDTIEAVAYPAAA